MLQHATAAKLIEMTHAFVPRVGSLCVTTAAPQKRMSSVAFAPNTVARSVFVSVVLTQHGPIAADAALKNVQSASG